MLEDRDSLIQRMNALHRQILMLQEARQQEIDELKRKFVDETENIVDALVDYLRSSEFERKFTTWKTEEIPAAEESWKLTKTKIIKALEDRFEIFLTKWEETNGVHAKVHDEFVQCFQSRSEF
jgi:malate synthase